MDEGRGLEGVGGGLVGHVVCGEAAEVVVEGGEEVVGAGVGLGGWAGEQAAEVGGSAFHGFGCPISVRLIFPEVG